MCVCVLIEEKIRPYLPDNHFFHFIVHMYIFNKWHSNMTRRWKKQIHVILSSDHAFAHCSDSSRTRESSLERHCLVNLHGYKKPPFPLRTFSVAVNNSYRLSVVLWLKKVHGTWRAEPKVGVPE